jgi:uncharacterized delta-60 repeat protein
VVGTSGFSQTVVLRYTSRGALDERFGNGGVVEVDFPGQPPATSQGVGVALQRDGKIVVAARAFSGSDPERHLDFAVARLNPDGSFDDGFGTGGRVTTGLLPAMDGGPWAIVIQLDGKIVLAGDAVLPDSATGSDFALVRHNADGSVDAGFGSGGTVTTDFGSVEDSARGLVLQADGKLVVAGFTGVVGLPPGFTSDFALARYNADGSLDDSFGSGGKVRTHLGDRFIEARGVALQPNGRIVVAGFAFSSPSSGASFVLARYLDGAPQLSLSRSTSSLAAGRAPSTCEVGE